MGLACLYPLVYVGTRDFPANTPKTRCISKHWMVGPNLLRIAFLPSTLINLNDCYLQLYSAACNIQTVIINCIKCRCRINESSPAQSFCQHLGSSNRRHNQSKDSVLGHDETVKDGANLLVFWEVSTRDNCCSGSNFGFKACGYMARLAVMNGL